MCPNLLPGYLRLMTIGLTIAFVSATIGQTPDNSKTGSATNSSPNGSLNRQTFEDPPNTQLLSVPMTPPQETLKMLDLPEGFRATLFAAEPDVHQPIAVTTDARGRLWVAECYTYSDGRENYNTQLRDRIVIFSDRDQDGIFDERTVFWDQGLKLTSLELGFGGVWVTAAPNLMFIPDRNHDDIPDGEPEILLDGFDGDAIRHNIVNGLRWGPDGWLYGRHGIQATSFVGPPGATVSQRTAMNCCIWRFHPTSRVFEIVAEGGTNPWGFDFNEHGEMFMINTVIGHLFHVVPNARFRRMYGSHFNPHTYQVIEQTADHFHWDVGEAHTAVTQKEGMSDGTDAAGGGHAHTGLMIYQGDNWPAEFRGRLFTANFHGRRINSDSLQREGNSFVAQHGPDYFKTTDPWFRGIELISGPDGGVYLLDWSDIGECHENDGIHRTSGRIFKLTYGVPSRPTVTDLDLLDNEQLIDQLAATNDWYARQSRRILQERFAMRAPVASGETSGANSQEGEIADALLASQLQAAYAAADSIPHKLRILWTMYSCNCVEQTWLIEQTTQSDENLRAWAVRLLTDGRLAITPDVRQRLESMADSDDSGLVRLYIASAMRRLATVPAAAVGDVPAAKSAHELVTQSVWKIASALAAHGEDASDRVQPQLIWYGIEPLVVANPAAAIKLATQSQIGLIRENIARRLTHELESEPQSVELLVQRLHQITEPEVQQDILRGMALALEGWSQASAPQSWGIVAQKLAASSDGTIGELVGKLSVVFGDGRALADLQKICLDTKADVTARRQAIVALAESGQVPQLLEVLRTLISDRALSTAVTQALVHCDQPEVADLILANFAGLDPVGKSAAISTLVARDTWSFKLLDAIEAQSLPSTWVNAARARQIMNFGNPELTARLTRVWGQIRETSAEREQQLTQLRNLLTDKFSKREFSETELVAGRQLFEKTCANCHTIQGVGSRIGPDLTGSDRRNLNYLLENIVDPSASVAESYRSSMVQLEDGRLLSGVVVGENDRTIQVQTADALLTIDRRSIEDMKKTTQSLMPNGLLDQLSEQEIVNLFGFLSN